MGLFVSPDWPETQYGFYPQSSACLSVSHLDLPYLCLCVRSETEYSCLKRPEEDIRSAGAGVSGYCELPSTGAGNLTQVLPKNSKISLPLSHLASSTALREVAPPPIASIFLLGIFFL